MAIPYPDHFGASDESPARLDVRVVRGDDWKKELFFCYAHRDFGVTPPRIIETALLTDFHVFESGIFHLTTRETFEMFDITDLPLKGDGWIQVWLRETQTRQMEPGTYGFQIASNNVQLGTVRTWVEGTITVLPNADWGQP